MLPEQAKAMSALMAPRFSLFFLLQAATGPVRAWLGVGDYALPADDVDVDGGVYEGIGIVGQIPALRSLIGGVAERVTFTLSGVDANVLALADADADAVRFAPVSVGILFFDDQWQAADAIFWLWEGTADVPSVDRPPDVDGHPQRSVSLSVGSGFTDRTRPQLAFYTDADQRRRSPTDSFCARVAAMSVDSTVIWPAPE